MTMPKPTIDATDWGPWMLYPPTLILVLEGHYYVDLERCLTSAEVLDWLCQIAGKAWADDETLAGLVRAVDDVLDPQRCLCSFGTSKRITRRDVERLVAQAAKRWPDRVAVSDE